MGQRRDFGRREVLRTLAASVAGVSASGWFSSLAEAVTPNRPAKPDGAAPACILLWMGGGPSQLDTFDPKPDHANGGEFRPIETNVAGLRISEHLPHLARQADKFAILRGLSTKEGDHGRGTYLMHTGQRPGGPVRYPTMGSALSKTLATDEADLPPFVSIAPQTGLDPLAFGPGYLGPRHAAVNVRPSGMLGPSSPEGSLTPSDMPLARLTVEDLFLPSRLSEARRERQMALWSEFGRSFAEGRDVTALEAHRMAYARAQRMMSASAANAFDLADEPDDLRRRYGGGTFGQGCLLARRLVERGVRFVEVAMTGDGLGWDTHQDNFNAVKRLSGELDQGFATLLADLADRGLLATTTILWVGEFGRTPRINEQTGRDHFPDAFSAVLAGGRTIGGQAYGQTSADGMEVTDGRLDQADLLATFCAAAGIDPATQHLADGGRPIAISEGRIARDVVRA